MKINSNINILYGFDIAESEYLQDKIYREYRRKWHNNPLYNIVEDFPLFLDIEATSICNLRCPHCVQTKANFKKGYMEFDLFKKIIDEASDNGCYGCKFHTIGRGEPLLHKDICKFIIYAKKKGLIDVYLNTNATLLKEDKMKELLDTGLDRISFSIDGYTKDEYEKNRKGADFNEVVKNVVLFDAYAQKYNIKIRIQTVELPDLNLRHFRDFWKSYCDEISYIKYKDMSNRENGIKSNWACQQLWQRMSVLFNGNILPCNHDDRELAVLGNAKEMSIRKAWSSMKYMREMHLEGNAHIIAACEGCYLRTSCVIIGGEV